MYHYFDNKQELKEIKNFCSNLVKEVENELRINGINSQIFLVGSGGRNMVTQNENEKIDFDYNLNVIGCENINDCKKIKKVVINTFNKILKSYNLGDVSDSTSSITTDLIYFKKYPKTHFSIDLAIVTKDINGDWHRLIHKKTGNTHLDNYCWNVALNSKNYYEKSKIIKSISGAWELVRNQYLEIKNKYLTNNDNNHPSFICYIESVNNVYNYLIQTGYIKK